MKNSLFFLALLLLSACTSYQKISSDFDATVDFTRYQTFAWLPDQIDTAASPYDNEIIRNNIRNYFAKCIADRGYRFDSQNPDLLLQLNIANSKKQYSAAPPVTEYRYRPYYRGSVYAYPYYYSYLYHDYASYPACGNYGGKTVDYVNGAITLNLIDRLARRTVWTGTASGDIYDPAVINRDLHPAVHRILSNYPVKPLVKRTHKIR
jgi:hypothetical protein